MECLELARKGAGVGTCGRTLDPHGNCDRAYDHVNPEDVASVSLPTVVGTTGTLSAGMLWAAGIVTEARQS